jgi:hypothetical protein
MNQICQIIQNWNRSLVKSTNNTLGNLPIWKNIKFPPTHKSFCSQPYGIIENGKFELNSLEFCSTPIKCLKLGNALEKDWKQGIFKHKGLGLISLRLHRCKIMLKSKLTSYHWRLWTIDWVSTSPYHLPPAARNSCADGHCKHNASTCCTKAKLKKNFYLANPTTWTEHRH